MTYPDNVADSDNRIYPSYLKPFLVLSALVTFGLHLAMSLNRYFDHDEFEALHSSWLLWIGDRPYVDFIQHHHLLIHYLLTPLFSLFGADNDVIVAARVLNYVGLLLMGYLTYHLALELGSDKLTGLAAATFLPLWILYGVKAVELRPDVPMNVFTLLGLVLVTRHARLRDHYSLPLAGVAFAVALAFLQKAAIPILLVGAILLVRLFIKDLKLAGLGAIILAGTLALLPFALGVYLTSGFELYWLYNYTYNNVYYDLRGIETFKLTSNIRYAVVINTPLALLLPFAFLKPSRRHFELLFYAAGVLGFAVLTGRHNMQYYMLAFPVVSVFAALGLRELFRRRVRFASATALLLLVPGVVRPLINYAYAATYSGAPRLAKIDYVNQVARPDARVYDGNILFNVFRRDVDFLWYMVVPPYKAPETMAIIADYDYDVYARIEERRPDIIQVYNPNKDNLAYLDAEQPVIRDNYLPSQAYDGLYLLNDPEVLSRERDYLGTLSGLE